MIVTTIEYRDTNLKTNFEDVEMPCIPPVGSGVYVKKGLVKITEVDYDPRDKRLYITGYLE